MLSTVTFAVLIGWIKELIHGNLQQGDNLIKGIKAWMLPAIFYVHNGTGITVNDKGQLLLR